MVNLPKKKVGLISCSGEELPEGTVSRLATLRVLEHMRTADTVTICLPLFLAGGEGDRAFAKFYPTIAVDGCELRCAARATEMYSNKPTASVVVRDLVADKGLSQLEGKRRLNEAGLRAVDVTAEHVASLVDEILAKQWNRQAGAFIEPHPPATIEVSSLDSSKEATCACGSGIPVQNVQMDGQEVMLVGLPLIFEQFRQAGKISSEPVLHEILDTVKIYNSLPVGRDAQYLALLRREYEVFCQQAHTT